MTVRDYAGAAKRTTLASDITSGSTTISVTDATGWPTGATGPFAIALEMGAAGEEKVLIASRSGNTLTVDTGGRGYDGTTAASHLSGSSADHVLTAIDLREANAHINATTGAHAATAISFAPAAGVAATTVQAAIEEVVSDSSAAYVAKADTPFVSTTVGAFESTTSAAYANLATVGPDVVFTAPASGSVLIFMQAQQYNSNGSGVAQAFNAVEVHRVSDSVVVAAASDTYAGASAGALYRTHGAVYPITGLTPGTQYRARAKYRGDGSACFFGNRVVAVKVI